MAKEPLIAVRYGKNIIGYTEKDQDLLESVAEGIPFKISTVGIKNRVGASHLRFYWACCSFMVNQYGDEDLNSKYKIDTYLRHELKFYDLNKCITKFENGIAVLAVMILMSISLKNLDYILKKDYFNDAIKKMAEMLGVDVKIFADEVKKTMKRRK